MRKEKQKKSSLTGSCTYLCICPWVEVTQITETLFVRIFMRSRLVPRLFEIHINKWANVDFSFACRRMPILWRIKLERGDVNYRKKIQRTMIRVMIKLYLWWFPQRVSCTQVLYKHETTWDGVSCDHVVLEELTKKGENYLEAQNKHELNHLGPVFAVEK